MTALPAPAAPRAARQPQRTDIGLSTTELMVAATVLVALSAFVGSFFVDAFAAFGKTHQMSATATQAHKGFLILDQQVRGAEAINRPVLVGSDWYVEFLTTASGTPSCTQWRVVDASNQLQTRQWTVSGGTATGITPWRLVAEDVANDPASGSQRAFRFEAAGSTVTKQSLLLHLRTRDGSGAQRGRAATRTRLVARNSSATTVTNADSDNNGRSDVEVCQEAGRS